MTNHITIPDTTPRTSYAATASQTVFPVPWPFFDAADVAVQINGSPAAGGYSVSGTAVDGGYSSGFVTFSTGRTLGDVITLYRSISLSRVTDFPYPSRSLQIEQLNTELDRFMAISQDLRRTQLQTVRAPAGEAALPALPSATSRASKLLVFDASGAPAVADIPGTGTSLTGNAALATVIANGGTTARTLAERFADRKNVRDFGAKGDDATDDTAAFQAAHDAMATGGVIEVPPGIYRLTTVTLSKSCRIVGANGGSTGVVTLKSISATNTMLNVTGEAFHLESVYLLAGVTRTAGALVKVSSTSRGSMSDFFCSGHYIGVDLDGVTEFVIRDGSFFFGVAESAVFGGAGVRLGQTAYTGVITIENVLFQTSSYAVRPTYGVLCRYTDVVNLTNVRVLRHVIGLGILPLAGQTASLIFGTACTFDSGDYGMSIAPVATAFVERCLFDGTYFGAMTQTGVTINGAAGTTDGVRFDNCIFIVDTVAGLNVDGVNAKNIEVRGGTASGCGIGFRTDNTANVSIRYATIGASDQAGANTTGVVIGPGVTGDLIGNRFTTNTAAITNLSTGILLRDNTPEGVVYQDPWTAFTPVATPGAGAITTQSGTGRYWRRGQTVSFTLALTVTTNGTGASSLSIALPFAAKAPGAATGRGSAVSGKQLQGVLSAGSAAMLTLNYDGTYPAASGETLVMAGTYEIQ